MKQECPTYFKIIGKSKVLAATLSDTESKDDFDYEDNEILNTFIATVNPLRELLKMRMKKKNLWSQDDIHTTYAKLYKVSEKHEKMYRLATKKLSDVELE